MSRVAEIFDTMSYGPAPEEAGYVRDWLKSHADGFGLFIGGEWRKPAETAAPIVSINPATGERLGEIAQAGAADVDAAVAAARAAFPAWSALPGHARARVLYALGRLVQKHSRFFAVLETLDNGKPIRETRDIDVPLVARHFTYHAGWAEIADRELPGHAPLGVIGQVIPWNFPLLMLAWKIAPALAAGNTVVLKPAEYTSLTALYFAELCAEAGVPPGVINIVTGDGRTGSLLVEHPGIDKIAFTGSTRVGRYIREATAGSGKSLTLELGGKSPFVVFEDADLDAAVDGLVDAIWFNQGQVCCAGSRLLVEEGVAGRLIDKIKTRLGKFRIGDPLDKAVDMGALVAPVQRQRVHDLVNLGVAEGATLWQPDIPVPEEGCFYPPTLLTDVASANIVQREEIFGPVLTVTTFRTLKEAIELANNTRYGLAATIYSENINRALEAAAKVRAGVVWINTTNQFDAACGFGGVNESGFGREGGLEGLLDYLKPKNEWTGRPAVTAPAPTPSAPLEVPDIDRTFKNYIGGKQTRPDGGNSRPVIDAKGGVAGWVGEGNRKDIRDAVEAAFLAESWSRTTGYLRGQILFYIAENLSQRKTEFERRLAKLTGISAKAARTEVEATIDRLFAYAGWADKFDGQVHTPPVRNVALAVNEPIGVIGAVCSDEAPLLSFVSLFAPAIALGNRCVIVPSERMPLPAVDFYQILETSDVPAGVVNIVTGGREELTKVLANHDQVGALWYFGSAEGSAMVEKSAAATIKRTWVNRGRGRDWLSPVHGEGRVFLRHASQVKNIWLPYGD